MLGGGGRWAKKTNLRGFGQCEASEGVPSGCTGGLVWAVPPRPCRSLHTPVLSGCPESAAPQPCRVLFLFYYYFFPNNILAPLRSQFVGRKVEDFHKNLNSSSCLSNNRIWVLNLVYIYIYIHTYSSDITVKGKAVCSLCFLLYVISAGNQNIFTYHRDQKTIYLYSYQTQALTQGGPWGYPSQRSLQLWHEQFMHEHRLWCPLPFPVF